MSSISIALNTTAKTATITGDTIAVRDAVSVTLTNTGSLTASGLRLGVINMKKELLASVNVFNDSFVGSLDLNKSELIAEYRGLPADAKRNLTLAVWDITNTNLVLNGKIEIQNNPYSEGMDEPTSVDPIASPGADVFTTLLKAKLDGIEETADVTDSANVEAAGAVMKTAFGANSILAADTASTPTSKEIAEGQIVGRAVGGNIVGLTSSEVRTLLDVAEGAEVNQSSSEIKTSYESNDNTNAFTDVEKTKLGYLGLTGAVDLDAISTKIGFLGLTGAVDLDSLASTVESHATNITAIKNKTDNLTVTAATDLDQIRAKANFLSVTGSIDLDALAASVNGNSSTLENVISGPGTSTNGYIPRWNGTTGSLLTTGLGVQTTITSVDTHIPTSKAVTTLLSITKLDDFAVPDDNTDLNASTLRHGLMPKLSGNSSEFFLGDGTWASYQPKIDDLAAAEDNTDLNATTLAHGLMPKLSGDTTQFMSGAGTWLSPLDKYSYEMNFQSSQLDVNGVITVPHNLGSRCVHLTLMDADGQFKYADQLLNVETSSLDMDLSTQADFTGYWTVRASL